MQGSLVDVVREIGDVDSLSELRGRDSKFLFNLACSAYAKWADNTEPPRFDNSEAFLRPLLTPSTFSGFDEVEVAHRCVLTCGRVVIQISNSINYARCMMLLLLELEEAIDKGLVTLIPDSSIGGWFEKWMSGVEPGIERSPSARVAQSYYRVHGGR